MRNERAPAIFWHLDPVCPDETLVISGNTLRGAGTHALNFCSEIISENNLFEGSWLSGGGNIALHFGGCPGSVFRDGAEAGPD